MPQHQNSQEMYQDVPETSYLIDLSQLDDYEDRVRETILLYYGDNDLNTQAEVAEELGVTRTTVKRRLNSDEAKSFEKMFSHKDKEELERWLEDLAARHFNLAINGLKTALKRSREQDDVSPQVLTNAATSLLKADKTFFENLQELGVVEKPKERREIEDNTGPAEISINEYTVEEADRSLDNDQEQEAVEEVEVDAE